jgi:hypothetical protein
MSSEARQGDFYTGSGRHGVALVRQPEEHLPERVVADFRLGKRRAQMRLRS